VSNITSPVTAYSVHRLSIAVPASVGEFQQQYEQAVLALPRERVDALMARNAPWEEMLDLIVNEALFGFLIYWRNDVHPVMRLAGDAAEGIFYLMGNQTIAERMYRYHPAVMLCAPLHTMIWQDPAGGTRFTFDRPSDQFGSFGAPQITEVGIELDQKLAALLDHLGLNVPGELKST